MSKSSQSKSVPQAAALAPEGMLAFNREAVDAYGRAWGSYLEVWNKCGRELMDFAASRLRKDTELGESLSKCRSWDETAEVQSAWVRTAFDDYARETEKVMEIMSLVATPSHTAKPPAAAPKSSVKAAASSAD